MQRKFSFEALFVKYCGVAAVVFSLGCLIVLLTVIFINGIPGLRLDFLTHFPSRFPAQAGIFSALIGTFWILVMTALFSIPLGVMTGIYLEELAKDNWVKRLIQVNIANLSGVPSVVYGILGLAVFVRFLGFDRSILSGALTMSLLILPIIIIATTEAIRAVPLSIRLAAFGVGASPRQVIWYHVLPEAMPGILTGVVLALSRAIGESAPLIMIGALSFVAFVPHHPLDSFTVLSIQIFNWVSRPQEAFHALASSAIVVLLGITLSMNVLAIYLRTRFVQRRGGD
ncbi:MAG: pstA [Bacteriovoracaceae bacterium]|nr:pstA [Bacteriovoracaceae bacterium]